MKVTLRRLKMTTVMSMLILIQCVLTIADISQWQDLWTILSLRLQTLWATLFIQDAPQEVCLFGTDSTAKVHA